MDTTCGKCGTSLRCVAGEWTCSGGCPVPMYGGMLNLDIGDRHYGGIARCCAPDCGWEGVPTYANGEPQTECPKCEDWLSEFGDDPDLRTHRLRHDIHIRASVPRRIVAPKQGRNDPCWCGSGKKFKKCCA